MKNELKIICDSCKRFVFVEKVEYDPPQAHTMRGTVCPECDTGGFDMPEYYDEEDNYIDQSEMMR